MNLVTDIKSSDEQIFSVYPNPANDNITIDSKVEIKSIEVYSNQGQLVKRKDCSSFTESFDLSDLSNGIYFLKLKTEKQTFTQKIIKLNN